MGSVTPAWYSKGTVAVVTGSNKGIGRQIVKDLAKHGITVVLTSRDTARGEQAVAALKAEGLDTVVFYPGSFEVTSQESVDKFTAWLKSEFGGWNILINNAGVLALEISYEAAKYSIDVNYISVKTMTKTLLPLKRPGARIVNIGTSLGMLSYLKDESLAKKLDDVDNLTEEFVDSCATKYLEDVKAGRAQEEGWSAKNSQYAESKIFMHAYTRVLAKQLASSNQNVSVNAVHPGFIDTDMTKHMGPGKLGVEAGSDTAVWLALLPEEDYPNGLFFSDRKPHDYWTSFYGCIDSTLLDESSS